MLKSSFLQFGANLISSFRLKLWNIIESDQKIIKLNILKDTPFKFYAYGDIVRFLYSQQLLVPFKKSFEYETLELFTNLLNPNSVVLDIGANIGLFSILGSKYITGQGKIYAFEPTTKTFEMLQKNIEANGITNVDAYKIAFSNTKTLVSMQPPKDGVPEYSGDSFNQIRYVEKEEQGDVIMTSLLDEFVVEKGIHHVDVIKIDIEGAELFCFEGGITFLSKKHKPVIIFECFESHCSSFGYKAFDVLSLLDKAGYEVKQYSYFQWIATPRQ
jgi:FkbM family methyltransferase